MQEIAGLVSVVIPAYNAAGFLLQTIDSVRSQTWKNWEIIVVNDGSTDDTSDLVKRIADNRIRLIEQENSGVSVARNNALAQVNGEFVVFLDADDLLSPRFMESRIKMLGSDSHLGFVGGLIETFPGNPTWKKAVARNVAQEILFFEQGLATIPSNYMFRTKTLLDHGVIFNPALSSTADRFFLLSLSRFTKGERIDTEEGKLLYRVSDNSMSQLSKKLMQDNEEFYRQLKKEGLLPVKDRSRFISSYFYSLSLGFAKLNDYGSFFKYAGRAAFANPGYFFKLLFKKIRG